MKHLTRKEIKEIEQETGVKAQKCPTCNGSGIGPDNTNTDPQAIVCLNCVGMGVIFPGSSEEYWVKVQEEERWKSK